MAFIAHISPPYLSVSWNISYTRFNCHVITENCFQESTTEGVSFFMEIFESCFRSENQIHKNRLILL